MVISIGLTFPVVKKETRQNFMRKVFLEDDLLKKPYKRFLIFFILLSFGALDYFLKRISG